MKEVRHAGMRDFGQRAAICFSHALRDADINQVPTASNHVMGTLLLTLKTKFEYVAGPARKLWKVTSST